jgi:hypothetical protein
MKTSAKEPDVAGAHAEITMKTARWNGSGPKNWMPWKDRRLFGRDHKYAHDGRLHGSAPIGKVAVCNHIVSILSIEIIYTPDAR